MSKKCIRCTTEKDILLFGRDAKKYLGHKDVCKECESKRYREKRSYENTTVKSLNGEVWLPVVGYEGLYEVSNLGRIKGLRRDVEMKGGKSFRVTKEALVIGGKTTTGYRKVMLTKDSIPKHFNVHRLVAESFIPKISGKDIINHIDCNGLNNNVSNLEWCTQKENIEHASKMGRLAKGERHHKSTPVIKCDLKGKELKKYTSISEAASENKLLNSGISLNCSGGVQSCGGFKWKYA